MTGNHPSVKKGIEWLIYQENSVKLQKNLLDNIRFIINEARSEVFRQTNTIILKMYWEIGQLIVEGEQKGESRAAYGKNVLKNLASQLTLEFGKGFEYTNLTNMRNFYLAFPKFDAVRQKIMTGNS